MIPKKIHFCWFGTAPKPKSFQRCLASWQQYGPDFEIVEWNEINSPNKNQSFYKNALRKKQYAFVSDSVRATVLYEHGGIYLDTDMLLLKPIDSLLQCDFFSGEEVPGRVAYGCWGAVPKHRFLKKMKYFYDNTYFNEFSPPVITHAFKHLVQKKFLQRNEVIFTPEVFYPLPYEKKEESIAAYVVSKSIAVHLWDHSWKQQKQGTISELLLNILKVTQDFLFFKYPYPYFRRYFKEFSRKLFQKLRKRLKS